MNTAQGEFVAESPIDLTSIFSTECVIRIPSNATKRKAMTSLVESLAYAGLLPSEHVANTIKRLLERERYGTTGLSKGIALPHLRTRAVDDFVGAVGVAPAGINFETLDGLPTRLILLLLSPFDEIEKYVEIIGRLARLLGDETLQYLIQVPRTPELLFQFLGFQSAPNRVVD